MERIRRIADAIRSWDTRDVRELLAMIVELRRECRAEREDPATFVDLRRLPSARDPDMISVGDRVWAVDQSGCILWGDDADQVWTPRQVRARIYLGPF